MFNKKSTPDTKPEKTTTKPIAETRFYTLELYVNPVERVKTYVVVNKEYGVVESSCEMLPQAFSYLEELDTALAAAYDSYSPSENSPVTLH